jgi:hypothetical protein
MFLIITPGKPSYKTNDNQLLRLAAALGHGLPDRR